MKESVRDELKQAAMQAAMNAWAPYSGFRVGAAVRGRDGTVYAGCNVENSSFGLTQCAERTALTAAVASGAKPGEMAELVIYTPGDVAHPPCGACRQVMQELMSPQASVNSVCDSDHVRSWRNHEYLPDPFEHDLTRPDSGGDS